MAHALAELLKLLGRLLWWIEERKGGVCQLRPQTRVGIYEQRRLAVTCNAKANEVRISGRTKSLFNELTRNVMFDIGKLRDARLSHTSAIIERENIETWPYMFPDQLARGFFLRAA